MIEVASRSTGSSAIITFFVVCILISSAMKNLKSSPEANGGLRGSQSMVHFIQNFPNFLKKRVLSGPGTAQERQKSSKQATAKLQCKFWPKYAFLQVFKEC